MGSVPRTAELPLTNQGSTPAFAAAAVRPRDPRNTFLRVSLIVLGLSLSFSLAFATGIFRTSLNAISIAIFFYTIVLIVVKNPELRGNPFHPFSLLLIALSLNYGIRAITLEGVGLQVDTLRPGSSLDHLSLACLLATIFIVLCYAGFRSSFGFWLARTIPLFSFSNQNPRPHRWVLRAYILAMIGLVARGDLIANGVIHRQLHLDAHFLRYASFLTDLTLFTTYAAAALMGLVLLKKVSPLWLAPLVILQILVELRIGRRGVLLFELIYALALYSYYLGRVRWRHVLVGTALILFVIAPLSYVWRQGYYNTVLRSRRGNTTVVNKSTSEMIARPFARVMENPDISAQRLTALGRFGELDMLLKVLDRVPRLYPFQNGDTFIPYLLELPIPRFLWPSKPFLNVGRKFAILFGDSTVQGEVGTYNSIGLVAELYFNFGYFGLLVSPIFGIVIRFFWERWKHYSHLERCAAIRMPYILIQTTMFDAQMAGYTIGLIRGQAVVWLFMVLFYGRLPTMRWMGAEK